MGKWTVVVLLLLFALGHAGRAHAQQAGNGALFVDVAAMSDQDPFEFFYGPEHGKALRGAVGYRFPSGHGIQLEIDVPLWRHSRRTFDYIECAPAADCVFGPGKVPALLVFEDSARTVSFALEYAGHVPISTHIEFVAIGGIAGESRQHQQRIVTDELDPQGQVARHRDNTYSYPHGQFAFVGGVDVPVTLTRHLAIVPQVRAHWFWYPPVSIVRPGVAVRWTF